jgi:hypothetical protein
MRDFYIILAEIGWAWVALLAVAWAIFAFVRRRRDAANNARGLEVQPTGRQPTERHEEHR